MPYNAVIDNVNVNVNQRSFDPILRISSFSTNTIKNKGSGCESL